MFEYECRGRIKRRRVKHAIYVIQIQQYCSNDDDFFFSGWFDSLKSYIRDGTEFSKYPLLNQIVLPRQKKRVEFEH